MTIEVIDNFLSPVEFKQIQNIFLSDYIDWFWNDSIVSGLYDDGQTPMDHYQFTHTLKREQSPYPTSKFYSSLYPLFDHLNAGDIYRVKANLNPKDNSRILGDFHIDMPGFECMTAIYYITTTNGPTLFQNGKSVDCIENRVVIFESTNYHCGTTCSDKPRRVLININYKEQES